MLSELIELRKFKEKAILLLNTHTSPDSNAAYGIAVGYDHDGTGTNNTILTLKDNVKINVDNTEKNYFKRL